MLNNSIITDFKKNISQIANVTNWSWSSEGMCMKATAVIYQNLNNLHERGIHIILPAVHPNVRVNNYLWRKVVKDGMETLQTTGLIQGRSLFDPFNQCIICQGST